MNTGTRFLLGLLACAAAATAACSDTTSASLPSDPPRVKIVENRFGKAVRAGNEELLRGGAAWVYQYGRQIGTTKYIHDPEYWRPCGRTG